MLAFLNCVTTFPAKRYETWSFQTKSRLAFTCWATVVAAVIAGLVGSPAVAAPKTRHDDRLPGRYIVVYEGSVDHPRAKTNGLEKRNDFTARFKYDEALDGFAARLSDTQVDALRSDPTVAFVSPDREVHTLGSVPLNSGDSAPAGVRRVEAATATSAHEASDANVAVIDTGVDLDHSDLNVVDGKNCVGAGPADDDHGHGSHVAGTIGAKNNGSGVVGVAPGTKIYSVKALNAQGSGTWSQIISAVDWVTSTRSDSDPSNDIQVANMSLGGGGVPVNPCSTTTDALHKAICRSTTAGVTYAVAAGNDGWDFDYAPQPDVPAAYPEVLTVSAVSDSDGVPGGTGGAPSCRTSEDDDSAASFSNYAATAGGANHTIAAPGVCVYSTTKNGGYTTMSGTSMASPHMAGAIGLCLGEAGVPGPCTGLTPAQIVQKMRSDAAQHTTSYPAYGFAGDPSRPISGLYYGHLNWVGLDVPPPVTDSTPPEVVSVSPANGSIGIAPSTSVGISFNEPMNQLAAQNAFSLTKTSDGSPVGGSFSWSGNLMTFKPGSLLAEGETYTAAVDTAATDTAGNALVATEVWGFSTLDNVSATPTSVTIQSGSLRSGGATNLVADDGSFFQANSTTSKPYTSSWFGAFDGVSQSLNSLSVFYSGKNSRSCTQTLSVWNWDTNAWVQFDSRTVGTTEIKVTRSPTGTLSNFVSGSAAEGSLRVRVLCKTSKSFYASGDILRIDYSHP